MSIGTVRVCCSNITSRAEYLTDVLRQIPTIGVPCAVLADGKRASGYRLRRIPGDKPQAGMVTAGEITTGDLQVAPVDVTLVQRDTAVDCNLLRGAATHVVVFAMDACAAAAVDFCEIRGAVFGIVAHRPDTGGGLYAGLVASFIVGWDEIGDIIHREHGVLVERVALVAGDFFRVFLCGGAVADVVVGVAIAAVVDGGAGELAAGVVAKAVSHRLIIAGGAAGERTPDRIVSVGALHQTGAAALVVHAGEQVALRLVFLRERHVAGQRELLQQVTAGQVLVAELLFGSAMHEASRGNAAIGTVAGGDGLLGAAILGIGVADTATHSVACFGDEVGLAARQQRIGFRLAVLVVTNGAHTGGIRHLRELSEMVVGIAAGGSGVGIGCAQQQSAGGFVAVCLYNVSGIRFSSETIESIVCLHHAAGISVSLAKFQSGCSIELPCGHITIRSFARVGADGFRPGAECLE